MKKDAQLAWSLIVFSFLILLIGIFYFGLSLILIQNFIQMDAYSIKSTGAIARLDAECSNYLMDRNSEVSLPYENQIRRLEQVRNYYFYAGIILPILSIFIFSIGYYKLGGRK